MALSSAQAAIIAKTAAISDVEFKASQITTQRLEYSQTTANIYQQLSNMDVPTPPQRADFNQVEYSFVRATSTLTLGNIRPNEHGNYNIELIRQAIGDVMQDSGTASVNYDEAQDAHFVQLNGGTRQIYTLAQAVANDDVDSSEAATYVEAYRHTNSDAAGLSTEAIMDMLSVYFDQIDENNDPVEHSPLHFLMTEDVNNITDANFVILQQFDMAANGTYSDSTVWEDCKLTFDASTGRILTIQTHTTPDASHNDPYSRAQNLRTTETTNEAAYNEAFNQYEYEQHLYEQEQAKLNAKLEDIQYEDKKLEVELQGLQTQRSAMQKELESLQKVRDDSIESGFKGFA